MGGFRRKHEKAVNETYLIYDFWRDCLGDLKSLRLRLMLWLRYKGRWLLHWWLELLSVLLTLLSSGMRWAREVFHVVIACRWLLQVGGLELHLRLVDLVKLGCH